ncbi:TetR/AcrR family transcriptional regulator [Nocardia sp. NBC_00508]|uniref:TetR/AcrR family transcriptional regulator n=1 Tax=Nocardia sp. NBC_00508 TaxID=2975992 RepID=UPI002E802664|nr:helix-turn-helix domain-containing protein [Nocardia sp. NBC_00508]WUD65099.1 TetR/AcrR family transcriptional regulator [Nocardia sp. NBC_00508]
MTSRRRLSPDERRRLLLDAGAKLFAEDPYDAVLMEDVAAAAGVSRALLYRHFPSKRDLFAAVYQLASDRLLIATTFDAEAPLTDQLAAGLDTHFDYFEANANTVLAANRVLAADPTIQAIITGELGELRERVLDALGLHGRQRATVSVILMSWLTFVRVLTVDWLENGTLTRAEMRETSLGALLGALRPIIALDAPQDTESR